MTQSGLLSRFRWKYACSNGHVPFVPIEPCLSLNSDFATSITCGGDPTFLAKYTFFVQQIRIAYVNKVVMRFDRIISSLLALFLAVKLRIISG
jgi:hypothetical protein